MGLFSTGKTITNTINNKAHRYSISKMDSVSRSLHYLFDETMIGSSDYVSHKYTK